jgi:hypothetical protein
MKRLLPFFLLCATCAAQTINPNQIRPATSNGQVLTTVTANQPPSWQAAADTATAEGVAPCTVNGVSGSFESPPFTIGCNSNFQPATPDPLGTQSELVYPQSCVANSGAACFGNMAGTVFSSNASQGLSISDFALPACVSPSNVTDAYMYVTSSADIPNGLPTSFSINNTGGGVVSSPNLVPSGGSAGIGGQPLWATSTVGQHFTSLPTNYSAVQVIAFGSFGFTGYLTISNVVMRVYYSGAACPAQTAINLNTPLSWDVANSSIFISSPFINAIDTGAVNVYTARVLLLDASNGGHPAPGDSVKLFVANANTSTAPTLSISNATDTSNRTIVNAPATGSSTTTALSVGQLQVGIPYTLTLDQAGKWEIPSAGSGSSGTVSSCGTINAMAYYAATGTVVSCDTLLIDSSGTLTYSGSGGVAVSSTKSQIKFGAPSVAPDAPVSGAAGFAVTTTGHLQAYDAITNTFGDVCTTANASGRTGCQSSGSGVTQITGPASTVTGPVTFTGSGVSQASSTFTFSGSGGGGNTLPFSVIQEGTFFYAGTGGTYTFPSALQSSGSTAYIFVAAGGSVSGTCPTGWTQDINITGGSFDRLMVCHKAAAGDTTADMSGMQFLAGYFVELNGSRTIDQSSTGNNSGTADFIILPSITPTASSITVGIGAVISSSSLSLGATVLDPVLNPLWTNIYVQNGSQHFLIGHIYGQTSAASMAIQPPNLSFSGLTPLSSGGFAWATFNIK